MGLFSLNNILLENDNTMYKHNNNSSIDIDNIGYKDDNAISRYSFIQEGYDAILELNAFYCNAEREFFTKIMGSYGDSAIINESFSDFFDSIKKIIKKFIEWIKKIFKEFVAKIAGLVGSEKYIKKHHKLLNKFNSEDEFEFQGYKYTHLESYDDIPKAKAVDAFIANSDSARSASNGMDYLNLGSYFDARTPAEGDADAFKGYYAGINNSFYDLKSGDDGYDTENKRRKDATEKINSELSKRIDEVNDKNDDFYEEFRGIILGKANEKFDSKEFTDELFKIFRNDDDSTSSITIDSGFVSDAYRRFDKYKDMVKAIEKNKNDIVKDYEDLEKYLDKMIKYNKDTHKIDITTSGGREYATRNLQRIEFGNTKDKVIYDSSTADRMQSLLKVYSARVNQMCQIHTQAFTAKLEAAKDCFNQDKKILNKAIQQILKRSDKEGF